MPPTKGPQPPIDRPLSRAYLREFVGWSTAYPPGQSEPNSLRLMENVFVDRNGALEVRSGLRCLSYMEAPGLDPLDHESPGVGLGLAVVGSPEVFYLDDGSRALLFAVREKTSRKVGFRVVLFTGSEHVVHGIQDAEVGFYVPQTEDVLNFDEGTTHVEYLQINNRILVLSDNGEPARMFFVGGQKLAKKLKSISVPEWQTSHKLSVMHPDAAWINTQTSTYRTNTALNPSFEVGTKYWSKSKYCTWRIVADNGQQGGRVLEVESAPERTNMQPSTLYDVVNQGFPGWIPGWNTPAMEPAGAYLQITPLTEEDFLAEGPRIFTGVVPDAEYRVALDISVDPGCHPIVVLESFAPNGMSLGSRRVEAASVPGRWVSPPLAAATGATSLRLHIGGRGTAAKGPIRFRNIVVCRDGEPTGMFHGSLGGNYYWTGDEGLSASVYHPPQDIWVKTSPYAIQSGSTTQAGSIAIRKMQTASVTATVYLIMSKVRPEAPLRKEVEEVFPSPNFAPTATWTRYGDTATISTYVSSQLQVQFNTVARGQRFQLDGALMEAAATNGVYFDGSTPSTASVLNEWHGVLTDLPHEGPSQQTAKARNAPTAAETPTTKTLVASGGAASNPFKMAFFYTFENDIGESAPSRITEIRTSRAWSNWYWETANASGEPSGTYTENEALVADQLVVKIPKAVYDQAALEGALRWNLYAFSWSDQAPVPTVAQLIEKQDIFPDQETQDATPLPWELAGWIQVTPTRRAGTDDTVLPTRDNRMNSSIPPAHRNGIVAGDRMVLVGSPAQPAAINWSSSSPGRYTMFTPNKGGGQKTLTSGNLNLPFAVALWQNPQSIDTLTILCSDDNGRSTSYYMSPASITAGNTGTQSIMGFEETTSTPGTIAPFGAEVMNNALYRPLDRFLLKSTASNYNINHKTQTDKIVNMWQMLESKQNIMSAQLDNRLFYLVNNPEGEMLREGCKGNEIWLFDAAAENGHWSRLMIHGSALKPVTVGALTYMCVSTDDGLYYLEMDKRDDDYAAEDGYIRQRSIPWKFETNTQGANRAHDAWAHLQQVGVVFGNFLGSASYGVRGMSLNGKRIDVSKVFTDSGSRAAPGQRWDVEDILLIRRDMKEWYFYASSLPGAHGTGQIGIVQYRYTPVSVNVGYEFGSVETFEYGSDVQNPNNDYSQNGIPRAYLDYARP